MCPAVRVSAAARYRDEQGHYDCDAGSRMKSASRADFRSVCFAAATAARTESILFRG